MSNTRLTLWMPIALMISVLVTLCTIYYAVHVQQELTTIKNAQIEKEKLSQKRMEDLQKEAEGFSRLIGGDKQ
jgi:hypothetical protein